MSIDDFSKLTKMILRGNKVYALGFNRSALSAKQLSLRALSLQVDIGAIINDITEMKDIIRLATKDDLFIIITSSDNTHMFENSQDILYNCNYVVVTFNPYLSLLKNAKLKFVLPSNFKKYGTFFDEQTIFFVWIEILMHMIDKKV